MGRMQLGHHRLGCAVGSTLGGIVGPTDVQLGPDDLSAVGQAGDQHRFGRGNGLRDRRRQ
jgi:hypothetical protein